MFIYGVCPCVCVCVFYLLKKMYDVALITQSV